MQGLKSRAAFKLLEVTRKCTVYLQNCFAHAVSQINERYKIFKSGQTVVDLVGPVFLEL